MTFPQPMWLYDLITAIENHEDTHPTGAPCFDTELAAVPLGVRREARAIASYNGARPAPSRPTTAPGPPTPPTPRTGRYAPSPDTRWTAAPRTPPPRTLRKLTMADTTDTPTFAEWVILEILGHRRMAGYLTEQQIAGHGFLRLDIPAADGQGVVTQYYAPSSIYAIHPTTPAIAKHTAQTYRPAPVQRWELPAAEPAAPKYFVDGQYVDQESYEAWVNEGRDTTAEHDPDYGKDLNAGSPF